MRNPEYSEHNHVPYPDTGEWQEAEQSTNYGRELLKSVDENTLELGYGIYPPSQIFKRILRQYYEEPNKPQITIAMGSPGSGKTTLMDQGLYSCFSDDTYEEVAREIYNESGQMSPKVESAIFYHLPWGDSFRNLSLRVKGEYEDEDQRSLKTKELTEAVNAYRGGLIFSLRDADRRIRSGETRPIIITGDIPVFSGVDATKTYLDQDPNDKFIGMPRGDQIIRELAYSSGPFQNLNYNDQYLAVYPSKEVFDKAQKNRRDIIASRTLEEKIAKLKESGSHINFDDLDELDIYLGDEQSANPEEMLQFQRDAFAVIQRLVDKGTLKKSNNNPEDFESFIANPRAFTYLHAQYTQWYMRDYLSLPGENVAIAQNESVVEDIHLEPLPIEIERIHPLIAEDEV